MKNKTTRFSEDLAGKHGSFWKDNALKEIAKMQKYADSGEICLDPNGGVYWKSSGYYLPDECIEKLGHTTFKFSAKETKIARKLQGEKFIEEYRKNPHTPSFEEICEMRAAFGKGAVVVDVFSGQQYKL